MLHNTKVASLKSLELCRFAFVASVRDDAPDLSARQMALLLSVYLGEVPHTVRGLANTLKISKPAISRALDRLGELDYIRRERDELDHRNVLVKKTKTGAMFLASFSKFIDDALLFVESMPDYALDFGFTEPAPSLSSVDCSVQDTSVFSETPI